jgi:hypothetical protein
MENILDEAWEIFYSNANLKDLEASEESSWKLYFGAAFFIAWNIQTQYNFRCYLPAYTESDTTPGGNSDIPYWDQSSFDIFCSSMKEFPIPKGVWELVDLMFTWVVQISQAYEKYSIRIPDGFIIPWNCNYDLADCEAARELLRVNMGGAITHAKKFGLKMGKWRDPVKPQVRDLTHPDVIAFFSHMHIEIYDDGTSGVVDIWPAGHFEGNDSGGDWTNVEYMFKNDPNESAFHVLAPWFGTYDATHNQYGGLIMCMDPNGAEYYISVSKVAQHGTGVDHISISNAAAQQVVALLKASFDNEQSGLFSVKMTGTHLTADKIMSTAWPLEIVNQLWMGTGRGQTEAQNDLLNYIGRLLV